MADDKAYYKSIVQGSYGFTNVSFYPFGIQTLDHICGGGAPVPRITEISGPSSHGKTALVLQLFRNNPDCHHVYIDSEGGVTKEFAELLGYTGEPLVVGAVCLEEGFKKIHDLVKAWGKEKGIIVWDSISACPSALENKHQEGFLIGSNAVAMSRGFREISKYFMHNETETALVIVSQVRQQVKIRESKDTAPKDLDFDGLTSIGGKALKFHPSLRLRVSLKHMLRPPSGGEPFGMRSEAIVLKSRVGRPFQAATFCIQYDGSGLHCWYSLIEDAINKGIIQKSGGWLKLNEKSYHIDDLVSALLSREISLEVKTDG